MSVVVPLVDAIAEVMHIYEDFMKALWLCFISEGWARRWQASHGSTILSSKIISNTPLFFSVSLQFAKILSEYLFVDLFILVYEVP